jgi:nucleoside-specific outer membrane channel protein Tsx
VVGRWADIAACLSLPVMTGVPAMNAFAADTSWTNLQVLYGDHFEEQAERRTTATLEHFSTWAYGDNFFFFDSTFAHEGDRDVLLYGEYYPRFSLGRITGKKLSVGPLSDVSVALGVNAGSDDFRVLLGGLGLNFEVPGFDVFQVDAYAYDQNNSPATYQVTWTWDTTFDATESLRLRFRGFIDYIGDRGSAGESQIVAQPQLLVDVGNFWNRPDVLFVGTEYFYWHNKFGIEGVTDDVVQAELLWFF